MKRPLPVALAALAAALAAGCGGAGTKPAGGAPPSLPSPKLLVLHASDLGPGYLPQAGATKPITLAHELLHESAPARVGIVSEAMTSRDALARTQDARLTAAS